MQYIRTAQQLGFTLAEIGDRLPAIWDAAEPGPALAQVLAAKLQEIDDRIAALQALRQSTEALNTHSDAAQNQRMVDALLSLSVTYRQLIMPLVKAVETRMGMDTAHPEVARVEGELEALEKTQAGRQKDKP